MDTNTQRLRAPVQDRSRRTLTRIVGAARELLAEEGLDAVTVQGVVARASASVGSFYARFPGKEELLAHVAEGVWEDAESWLRGALRDGHFEGLSLEEAVETAVNLLQASTRVAAGERRALRAQEGAGRSEREFQRLVHDSLRAPLLVHRSEMRHPEPELAVDVALRAVTGVLQGMLDGRAAVSGEGGEERDSDGRLRQELTRMCLAYMGGASYTNGPPQDSGSVDFFDVWG